MDAAVKIVRHGIMRTTAVEAAWDDSEDWDDSELWSDYDNEAAFLGEQGLLTTAAPAPGGFLQRLITWQSSDSFLFSPSEQVIYIDA
ncbi:hypothetical protein IQ273_18840 [Nodosilinea sp. LEGE 07298]|uniref:hypothetical protein n=1 Tax=Nodosilinea sp. LEGE 07298 TaxID=2777970 RepID=UPI00187F58F2|nr:hypothetical protein [Nodosilinea sp. LEGE 07298]MBE9111464.1 hypothetical protein [Nodosilinea sp. LEGE 07298]